LQQAAGKIDVLFVGACLSPLVQSLMVCYLADRLREASNDVAEGAFESIWRNKNRDMKKAIMMIIMRAQRPQHLRAFFFGNVTLATFTAIINAAYSYYSLLNTLA
jgi:7tm Odorant receptor